MAVPDCASPDAPAVPVSTSSPPSSDSARSIELTKTGSDTCQGQSVEILVPQRLEGDEAVVVWDAALVLVHFLEKHQKEFLTPCGQQEGGGDPIHLVDVGAGTGAVGLAAAGLGAKVTLTDLNRILPLLSEGIRLNPGLGGDQVRALPLTWGCAGELDAVCTPNPPDLICVSDCVYYEASLAPLVFTLRGLAEPKKAPILLSYEHRDYSPDKKRVKEQFFALVEKYFKVTQYSVQDCHPTFSSEDISMIRLDLKI